MPVLAMAIAVLEDRLVLSLERALHINKSATV
jgi:hypothetical protein